MPNFDRCSTANCKKPIHADGLCNTCYRRKLRRMERKSHDEAIAIYAHHNLKRGNNEMGIERGDRVLARFMRFAIGVLSSRNTLDLKTWIEESITLPVGNGYRELRKMNFEVFPHARDILALVDNPDCKRIVLCFAAQSGKTDTIASIAAYLTGYRNRRGIYVLPTANMLDKVRDTRLATLLEASREKVGFDKIENKNIIRFTNGNFFSLALASSPGTLAEQTGTSWVIVDEHDEYRQEGSKKHNPIDLAEKRMQTSPRRLTIIACTPKRTGVGYTYSYYNRTKRFVEEIQCPLCDGWFVPEFYQHFKWPGDVDCNTIEARNLAWVECPKCQGKITDAMHYFIVTKRKRWKCLDPDLTIAECGFRLPIFLTPNKNWSATVAAYLKSLDDPLSEADFNNSWLAKPKDSESTRRTADMDYSKLKGNWLCERGEIPEGVLKLTAGVDVGLREIWFVLLGWGLEARKFVLRSQKIDRGQGTESLAEAMAIATEMCNPAKYRCKGIVPKFCGGLVDSGDDTEAVYEFCREHFEWRPSKGYTEMDKLHKISSPDSTGKHRQRYDGLQLYLVNTNRMQNVLRSCFENALGAARSIQFAEDAPEILFQHIRNQQQYEYKKAGKPVWRWGKIGEKADHLLDALMQAMFAGDIMQLHKMKPEESETAGKESEAAAQPPLGRIIRVGNIYGR